MMRTFMWLLAACAFCLLLFFRDSRARADNRNTPALHVAWSFAGQVTPVKGAIAWTFTEVEPDKPDTPLPKSYAEARERALRTGLPLVVWVGDALCASCVRDTKEEFVHWVTPTFPDTPKDALVVAVREGDDLIRIGTMTQWSKGHITTVRTALDLFRTHKQTTDQRSTPYRGVQTQQVVYRPAFSYAPMRSYSAPAYRSRGRGGC